MNEYQIITDSSCDLSAELAEELQLKVVPLSVLLDGKQYVNHLDWRDISASEFFDALRKGKTGSTSAPNVDQFLSAMEDSLREGKDVLYLGFSSGLSGTYSAGTVAAEQLREKYPERVIRCIDTLCASLGEGLMLHLAVTQKRLGKTLEEVADYVEKQKLHLCHWFTVDDLHHLKRGGRVSAATALVGTMLGIKPVMHVDDDGHLVAVGKVRGRMNSIKALFTHMKDSAIEPEKQTVFISHGDCADEAEYLAEMIRRQLLVKEVIINTIGPVIGAHSGPGTIALFFLGSER